MADSQYRAAYPQMHLEWSLCAGEKTRQGITALNHKVSQLCVMENIVIREVRDMNIQKLCESLSQILSNKYDMEITVTAEKEEENNES